MVHRENKILVEEVDLGLSPYIDALKKQEKYFNIIIDQKIKNRKSTEKRKTSNFFLWVEHTPVITIGNRGNRNNLLINEVKLKEKKIDLFNTNRGGDITLHSPGQLVGYPIFDLENFFTDISRYLRLIEESVIKLLYNYSFSFNYRIKRNRKFFKFYRTYFRKCKNRLCYCCWSIILYINIITIYIWFLSIRYKIRNAQKCSRRI